MTDSLQDGQNYHAIVLEFSAAYIYELMTRILKFKEPGRPNSLAAMVYKRKRVYAPRYVKRRKVVKRRRKFRGSKSVNFTSQSGIGRSLPFKSRRLKGRTFRSKLWNDTVAKAHYRSCESNVGIINSNADPAQATIARISALENFWTAAGGAIPIDLGVSVPQFADDIIIRGGKVGIRLFNESTVAPLNVFVWLTRDSQTPNYTSLASPQPVGFDMSLIPDFKKKFGTILYTRQFLLEPLAESSIEYRLRVMKIDQQVWIDGSRFQWWVMVSDPDTANITTCRQVTYHNLSFSADALTSV